MASLLNNIASNYDPSKSYEKNARVLYNDKIYQCVYNTTGEFDEDAWVQIYISDIFKGCANSTISGIDWTKLQRTTTSGDASAPTLTREFTEGKIYDVWLFQSTGYRTDFFGNLYNPTVTFDNAEILFSENTDFTANGVFPVPHYVIKANANCKLTWSCSEGQTTVKVMKVAWVYEH